MLTKVWGQSQCFCWWVCAWLSQKGLHVGRKQPSCPICRGESGTAMTTNESAPRGSMQTCPRTVLSEEPMEGHSVPAALCACGTVRLPGSTSSESKAAGTGTWRPMALGSQADEGTPGNETLCVTLCSWGKSEASVALFIRPVRS